MRRLTYPDGTVTEEVDGRVQTTFPCGLNTSNWVNNDDRFLQAAADCGLADDLQQYLYEHEVCHLLVPLVMFGERGYVSWMAAQQKKMSLAAARAEEREIYRVQRATYLRSRGTQPEVWDREWEPVVYAIRAMRTFDAQSASQRRLVKLKFAVADVVLDYRVQ